MSGAEQMDPGLFSRTRRRTAAAHDLRRNDHARNRGWCAAPERQTHAIPARVADRMVVARTDGGRGTEPVLCATELAFLSLRALAGCAPQRSRQPADADRTDRNQLHRRRRTLSHAAPGFVLHPLAGDAVVRRQEVLHFPGGGYEISLSQAR